MNKNSPHSSKITILEMALLLLLLSSTLVLAAIFVTLIPIPDLIKRLFFFSFIFYAAVCLFSEYRGRKNNSAPIKYTSVGAFVLKKLFNLAVLLADQINGIKNVGIQTIGLEKTSEITGSKSLVMKIAARFWTMLSGLQKGIVIIFSILFILLFGFLVGTGGNEKNSPVNYQKNFPQLKCESVEYSRALWDGATACNTSFEDRKRKCESLSFELINTCINDAANKFTSCQANVRDTPCSKY